MFKNYSNLLQLLQNDQISREDTYSALMEKEKNVLDVASRVASQHETEKLQSPLFTNMSITDLIARFAYTWHNIFTETIIERRYNDLPVILFQNDRKFYVGIMIIFLAFFIILATL